MSSKAAFFQKLQGEVNNIKGSTAAIEGLIATEKDADTPKSAQVRMRGGELHVQYGAPGNYQKGNVSVSEVVGLAVTKAIETNGGQYGTAPSFAGSNSRYLKVGFNSNTLNNSGGYLSFLGQSIYVAF